jgi:tagaturonate epimerase
MSDSVNDIKPSSGNVYASSIVTEKETTSCLIRLHENAERRLGILGNSDGFEHGSADGAMTHFPLTAHNAAALRTRLPWLNARPHGLRTSYGFGDRMGLATPGHIQALRSCGSEGQVAPIFAQQSVRENTRTGRTPQQVMDDAMWGVFQEGWRAPWGADADHIKEISDLAPFVAAGYTFFTIDPSDYVDNAAQSDTTEALREKANALPWDVLNASYPALFDAYCREPLALSGLTLTFDETTLLRALAKYGRALAHTLQVVAALRDQMAGSPFDLEISIDETDTPTSVREHYLIANELTRRAVPVTSIAPRFVGRFQKGVDYIGNVAEFESEMVKHAAIMHHFGLYKLSIHTGSDKFSIYPIIAHHTAGRVHVKTAGTSYLEALRVASHQPELFHPILDLAHSRFEKDRKTYFLDARLTRVPTSERLSDADLPALLDQFDARQVLHVTFGSILDAFGAQLRACLTEHEAEYRAALEAHFTRHIAPFE